jgi:hypothetical protein
MSEVFFNYNLIKQIIEPSKKLLSNINDLELVELLPLFELNKGIFTPTNNIVLFIELQQDGTGDFGWIKEYIKIFNKAGYSNDKIYIISSFEFKFSISDIPEYHKINLDEFYNLLDYLNNITDFKESDDKDIKNLINSIENEINLIKQYLIILDTSYKNSTKSLNNTLIFNINNILNNSVDFKNNKNRIEKTIVGFQKTIDNSKKILLAERCNSIKESVEKICIASPTFINTLIVLFDQFIKFLEIFKSDSYINGVNYLITDMMNTFNPDYFMKDNNKCYLFDKTDTKNFLNNSIFITFTTSSIPDYVRGCSNIKVIEMQEGGHNIRDDQTNQHVLASGVGKNLLGLHNSFEDVESELFTTKIQLINMLKGSTSSNSNSNPNKITTMLEEDNDIFTQEINYHYAYIGQLDGSSYLKQFVKYLFENLLLFNLIHTNSTTYLFSYINITKNYTDTKSVWKEIFGSNIINENFKTKVECFFNFFGINNSSSKIKIHFFQDNINYDLIDTENKKILKVRYFNRLDKIQFLNMIKFSSSPVFSTGDLSSQEALLFGKYLIHDYIYNKQNFINKFIDSMCDYIGKKSTYSTIEKSNVTKIKDFYQLFKIIDKGNKTDIINIFKNINQSNKTFDELLSIETINSIKIHINEYSKFKSDIIDKIYNFDNNFIILLTIVNLCSKSNLQIPDFHMNIIKNNKKTNEKIIKDILIKLYDDKFKIETKEVVVVKKEEEKKERKKICTNCVVSGGYIDDYYYRKYLKYKNKYLNLKN